MKRRLNSYSLPEDLIDLIKSTAGQIPLNQSQIVEFAVREFLINGGMHKSMGGLISPINKEVSK